jgi:hypothetical protein
MARGTQLQRAIEMLQHECRLSTNTSRGLDNREYLKEIIRRTQEWLYDEYDWPFLRAKKDVSRKTVAAGQRYYDFPAGINPDAIERVWINYGDVWAPIEHGITPQHYSEQDSDNDERADPVQRWDWYGEDQFEVWPLPASNGDTIWFEGFKPLSTLTAESDTLDLDDRLVVLYAAAEILAANNQKDAQAKLNLAQKRLLKLGGRVGNKSRIVLGGGSDDSGRRRTTLRAVYTRDS